MAHSCSEPKCKQPLTTQVAGDASVIGTCKNPDCRLYDVTLPVAQLAAMPEAEREDWAEMNRQHKIRREALLRRLG